MSTSVSGAASDNFESVLAAAIELLQRRRRVTYGALKRQLGIDDAYLADLKDELILAAQVAREEHGKVLVWIGPSQAPERGEPIESSIGLAQRRQLTVMFCDLVGSTSLSSAMDPEEFSNLLHAYQARCDSAIKPLEGYVAQYLGDGILVYFGFPVAHEDDALRGVQAGLGIIDAITALNDELTAQNKPPIAVRIGVHTGLVVVDEVGAGTTREHLALGEVPNVAARLQALGEPNSVLISEATHKLVSERVEVESRGSHMLKGLSRRMQVFRVVRSRGRAVEAAPKTTLFGRSQEMAQLDMLLRESMAGRGQTVLISGEAGIGKSRIVAELRSRAMTHQCDIHVYHCSPHFSQTALYPISERLRRGLAIDEAADPLSNIFAFVDDAGLPRSSAVPLLGSLLSVPLPQSLRAEEVTTSFIARMQALVIEWLSRIAQKQPVLLVWEDLHWADPTSLELLGKLIDRVREAPVLLVGTGRTAFTPPWGERVSLTRIALGRLPRAEVEQIVGSIAQADMLPREVLEEVLTKTDGIPLFAEELTKTLLDADTTKVTVPATLQDSLMARLDRLGPAKEVAQLAATVGREFSYQVIADIADMPSDALDGALGQLVDSGLVRRYGEGRSAQYRFKHALVQDAAYEAILHGRRRPIHERIAASLQAKQPLLVNDKPELLAHHLTCAGLAERAVQFWTMAGRRAAERSANLEAVAHFDRGLEQLQAVPEGDERWRSELKIQIPRAGALRATAGFAAPVTGAAFERARALCRQLGDNEHIIPALNGIYSFYLVRNEHDRAGEAARELLQRAQEQHNKTYQMIGHRAVGAVLLHTGDPAAALPHLEQSIALYDFERHKSHAFMYGTDHKETAYCMLGVAKFLLGHIDQAYATFTDALAHAERLDHAHSIAQALAYYGLILSMNRDVEALAERAERLHVLCTQEHTFPYLAAVGSFWRAHADALVEPTDDAIARMQEAAKRWLATGGGTYQPYLLTLIGEAHQKRRPADGLPFIEQARSRIEATNERFTEAELHRTEGELQRALGHRDKAEACMQRALESARRHGLRVWERRAALSLAKLWRDERPGDAHALLAPIQQSFSEGELSVDHTRAETLLSTLAESSE